MSTDLLAAIEEFDAYRFGHPRLLDADRSMRRHIAAPVGAALVLLIGPTGVGKSTLLARVERVVLEESAPAMAARTDHIPIFSVTAKAPESGSYSWRVLYLEMLSELDEPGIEWKVDPERAARRHVGRPRPTVADLRSVLVRIVRRRGVRAIIIDEAHHIGLVGSGRKLFQQLEHLKSLSDEMGAVLVLAGTYQLLTFRNLSGQLGRRSRDVHLRRYAADDATDVEDFAAIVEHLAELMPLRLRVTPSMTSFLYEGSLGCVGLLKEWLVRALHDAAADGETRRMTRQLLIGARRSPGALHRAAIELAEGEETIADDDARLADVRRLLGVPAAKAAGSAKPGSGSMAAAGAEPRPKRGRRVSRRPVRDQVGRPSSKSTDAA